MLLDTTVNKCDGMDAENVLEQRSKIYFPLCIHMWIYPKCGLRNLHFIFQVTVPLVAEQKWSTHPQVEN